MKLAALALTLLVGCSSSMDFHVTAPQVEWDTPSLKEGMSLVSKYGFAHACPTDLGIFTANHVSNPYFLDPVHYDRGTQWRWEDGYGNSGVVLVTSYSNARDVARMEFTGEPVRLPVSREGVHVGSKVYWKQFSWKDDPMSLETQEAEVQQLLAGHIKFSKSPRPGASGGCLLNSSGEVVGIVVWGIMGEVGVAVSISGEYLVN